MSEMNYDPRHFEPPKARPDPAPVRPWHTDDPASEVLQLLACCNDGSDLATLKALSSKPVSALLQLEQACQAGLVLRAGDHHHYAQASAQTLIYQSLAPGRRAGLHLRIGRHLLAETTAATLPARLRPILQQLNAAASAMPMRAERARCAELNLLAAEQARAGNNLDAALAYLDAAHILLGDERWQRHGALSFTLDRQRAECLLLLGRYAELANWLAELAPWAADPVQQSTVARLQCALHGALNRPDLAMATALAQVSHTGLRVAPLAGAGTGQEAETVDAAWQALTAMDLDKLARLPMLSDAPIAQRLDAMADVLALSLPVHTGPALALLTSITRDSLAYGNSSAAGLAYVGLAILGGTRHRQAALAFDLAELGLTLAAADTNRRHLAAAQLSHARWLLPWHRPLAETSLLLERAQHNALVHGAPQLAAQAGGAGLALAMSTGQALAILETRCGAALAQLHGGFAAEAAPLAARLRLLRALRGAPDDGTADASATDWSLLVLTLQAQFHAGDHDAALGTAALAQPLLASLPAGIEHVDHAFYCGLAHAGAYASATPSQQAIHRQGLIAQHDALRRLTRHYPANFGAMAALLGAERSRLHHQPDAGHGYERAIALACEQDSVHVEALAHELAARWYREQGLPTAADAHHQHAQQAYRRWGADGQARRLGTRQPAAVHGCGAGRLTPLGEFAASVAHEVSQPLAAIVLNAGAALNWLKHSPPDVQQASLTLQTIVATGTRAGAILTCLGRLAMHTAPALAPLRLDEAVREVLALLGNEFLQHQIGLTSDLTLGPALLCADRTQLQQLIINLLRNAIDAMRTNDGRARHLTVGTTLAAGGTVCLSVADNGCGLPEGDTSRLFDALVTTKTDGMGMGLSICRTIAEAHGGNLWCTPRQPHGAVFHLQLPLAPVTP